MFGKIFKMVFKESFESIDILDNISSSPNSIQLLSMLAVVQKVF